MSARETAVRLAAAMGLVSHLAACDAGRASDGAVASTTASAEPIAAAPDPSVAPGAEGGASPENARSATPIAVVGDDASPTKIASCCADVQAESGKATPHRKLVYTAALQVCRTLVDSPTAGGGLISVRTLLRDVTLPPSCQ